MMSDEGRARSGVLVVDDHDLSRRATAAVLSRFGHTVVAAAGGEEALRILEELVPEVVILDLLMPGVDGWAVLARLKGTGAGPLADIPVIVLTGAASIENSTKARFEGAVACLPKPVTPAQLLDQVNAALQAGSAHQQRRQAQFAALRELARDQRGRRQSAVWAEPVRPVPEERRAVVQLTDRQHEVVGALQRHATMRDAARELLMSDSRISAILRRIAWKLDMRPQDLLTALRRRDPALLRSLRSG